MLCCHFIDNTSKAQRGLATDLRSHSQESTEWGLELSLSTFCWSTRVFVFEHLLVSHTSCVCVCVFLPGESHGQRNLAGYSL